MMDLQSEGKRLGESPAAGIRSGPDQNFNKEKFRTQEISAEEEEFIQTHYSPRGVIFLYYKGEASSEVDKHFSRSLAELCCLSEEDEIQDISAESSIQGEPALPMPQREFPASFWNPTPTSRSQQVETVCHWHSNTVDIVTISNCHGNAVNSTAANRHVNGSQLFTGQYGSCQQNLPNLIRAVPVPHVSLSVGSFSLGPNQQPAHSSRAPVLPYPYPQKVFAPYYDSQDSLKFDPRYNPLLVQPEVRPHLPTVPGEPQGKQHGRCEDTTGGFLGEPYTRNGEN